MAGPRGRSQLSISFTHSDTAILWPFLTRLPLVDSLSIWTNDALIQLSLLWVILCVLSRSVGVNVTKSLNWCLSLWRSQQFQYCTYKLQQTRLVTKEDAGFTPCWWDLGLVSHGFILVGPMLARERCRISPSRFLAECRKGRLNQGSFVLLCFVLFAFSGLCIAFLLSVFLICLLSCIF